MFVLLLSVNQSMLVCRSIRQCCLCVPKFLHFQSDFFYSGVVYTNVDPDHPTTEILVLTDGGYMIVVQHNHASVSQNRPTHVLKHVLTGCITPAYVMEIFKTGQRSQFGASTLAWPLSESTRRVTRKFIAINENNRR